MRFLLRQHWLLLAPGPDSGLVLPEGCLVDAGSQHSCVWLTLLSGPDCSCPIADLQQETTVPFLGPLGHTETASFQPESEWRGREERDEKGEMVRWKRRMTGSVGRSE